MTDNATTCRDCDTEFPNTTDVFCAECGSSRPLSAAAPLTSVGASTATPAPARDRESVSAAVVHEAPVPIAPTAVHPGASAAGPGVTVAPKSPGLALVASFFFPGLGSLINGDVGKGLAIFFGWTISTFLAVATMWIFFLGLIFTPFILGFFIWGMVDAYTGAQKWNLRHGIVS